MKTIRTKSKVILFILLSSWLFVPLEAKDIATVSVKNSSPVALAGLPQIPTSYGSIKQYSSLKGTRVITRATDDNAYHITCGYSSDNRSFFIVKNGSTTKSFYTSAPVNHFVPVINNHGFEIYDMVIYEDTCWFCGSFWYETGEMGQTIFGDYYWVVEHKGFVGRFTVSDVLNGSGTFYTTTIEPSYELTNIAASNSTVLVLGNENDGYGQFAAELSLPSSGTSDVTKVTPPFESEVFMDVTYTGDKFVILSRFCDSARYVYYLYRFGLRYFKPQRLANIDTMYVYDTWQLFFTNGWFTGVDPIHLCPTHVGDGVVVSWVEIDRRNPTNPYIGHLHNIKINSKGTGTLYGFRSTDTTNYTAIKEYSTGFTQGDTNINLGSMNIVCDIVHKTVSLTKQPINSYSYTSTTAQPTNKCGN